MQTKIDKLPAEQSSGLVDSFMKAFGRRIRARREKVNLSQKELARCLDLTASALSRYETGSRAMQVSSLPLFSVYCGVPMRELFPENESEDILEAFESAVRITAERYVRLERKRAERETAPKIKGDGDSGTLMGRVYNVNGKEVFVPVKPKYDNESSLKELYRSATPEELSEPCTEQELCDFLINVTPIAVASVTDAGRLLKDLADVPGKMGLRENVADYILDEIFIENISKYPTDGTLRQIYAYYKRLYEKFLAEKSSANKKDS